MKNLPIDAKLIICYAIYFILCSVLIASMVRAQDSVRMIFSWDAVTTNADGTPCNDLAGYVIYKSRINTPENWETLLTKEQAVAIIPPDQNSAFIYILEGGVWYWAIRAFDSNCNIGGYGGPENIIMTDVDATIPGVVVGYSYCNQGDFNCDGVIDGADLAIFAQNFGK